MLPPVTTYTINLDKLELMLTQDIVDDTTIFQNLMITNFADLRPATALPSYSANGFVLTKTICKDNNYHICYEINFNKITIGELLLNRTKFYESDNELIKLRIYNHVLYSNFIPVLTKFLTAFKFNINNITNLEIALDTNYNLLEMFYHYFKDTDNYTMKGGSQRLDSVNKFTKECRSGEETSTLYLGKTNKKLKIYNKTIELDESNKDHITKFHKQNGLDITKDIYRIEIKLTQNALKRYTAKYINDETGEIINQYQFDKIYYNNGRQKANYTKQIEKNELELKLEDYCNSTLLASIFKTILDTVCQFKLKDNIRLTRCTTVNLIDFANIPEYKYNTELVEPKNRNKNKVKELITKNLKQYSKNPLMILLQATEEMAKAENLLDFYQLKFKEFNIKPISTVTNTKLVNSLF